MTELESEQQFEELKEGYMVLEFTVGWCSDCKVTEPDLSKLEKKYSQLQFVSVDKDQLIDICVRNDILGIPSFFIFKEGQLLGSYTDKERKSTGQIDQSLSQHI